MGEFRFRVVGLHRKRLRRWRRSPDAAATQPAAATGGLLAAAAKALAVATIAFAVLFPAYRPREIEIVFPVSGATVRTSVEVRGRIASEGVREVTLSVNGDEQVVPMERREFLKSVPLEPGMYRIQAKFRREPSHTLSFSNVVRLVVGTEKLDGAGEFVFEFDEHGNPVGREFGLARDGEFRGSRILAWGTRENLESQVFTQRNPLWPALERIGFEVSLRSGPFDPSWLRNAHQLWLFSATGSMDESTCQAIEDFVRRGRGLYLLTRGPGQLVELLPEIPEEPESLVERAAPGNDLASSLFGASIRGGDRSGRTLYVRNHGVEKMQFFRKLKEWLEVQERLDGLKEPLEIDDHPLLTGINVLSEGAPASFLRDIGTDLETAIALAEEETRVVVSTDPEKNVVIDCAWERYDATEFGNRAGSIRFAQNVAAWLAGKGH